MLSTKDSVLSELMKSPGNAVSGAELARDLKVTRNAVWKAVLSLKNDGYNILSTAKGYALRGECDIINKQRICEYVQTDGYCVHMYDSVDSTNNVLKKLAQSGAPELTAVVAREQTAGRGRLGRSFFSPKDSGIYVSVLLRPVLAASDALKITTAVAVVVSQAIESVLNIKTGIKWVNDIYYGSRKVCGILTEASVDLESAGIEYAVVGIGVNVEQPEGGFPDEISSTADSLCVCGKADVKNRLVAGILDGIAQARSKLTDGSYVAEYKARSILKGKSVSVIKQGGETDALVLGIDDDFRLEVEYNDKRRESLSSGEVRIKLK